METNLSIQIHNMFQALLVKYLVQYLIYQYLKICPLVRQMSTFQLINYMNFQSQINIYFLHFYYAIKFLHNLIRNFTILYHVSYHRNLQNYLMKFKYLNCYVILLALTKSQMLNYFECNILMIVYYNMLTYIMYTHSMSMLSIQLLVYHTYLVLLKKILLFRQTRLLLQILQ